MGRWRAEVAAQGVNSPSTSTRKMERSRNVDVGRRIGRDLDAEAAKPRTLEQQEKLLNARREGDATMDKAMIRLAECRVLRELDRTPCLPGVWTLGLHERVVACLDEIDVLCMEAAELLKRGNALDRLPNLTEVIPNPLHPHGPALNFVCIYIWQVHTASCPSHGPAFNPHGPVLQLHCPVFPNIDEIGPSQHRHRVPLIPFPKQTPSMPDASCVPTTLIMHPKSPPLRAVP